MSWEDEDRHVVIAAAGELEEYLHSTQLLWRMSHSAGMLSLGSLQLCMRRLACCDPDLLSSSYPSAVVEINRIKEKFWLICERKIAEEIPYRVRLWKNSIEEYAEEGMLDHSFHAQVKNRVIIELLWHETRGVTKEMQDMLTVTDSRLRSISSDGPFLWDNRIETAFDRIEFWFLYLQPGKVG